MSGSTRLKLIAYATFLVMFVLPTFVKAATVDVSASWEYWRYNYEPIYFAAGTYKIAPIGVADGGLYNAWNAWGPNEVAECNSTGVCSRGYLNSYSFGYVGANDQINEIATLGGTLLEGTALAYETPLLALAHAESYIFSLAQPERLYFYVKDGVSWYPDNVGGVSLLVHALPEPESYVIVLIGLFLLGVFARPKIRGGGRR